MHWQENSQPLDHQGYILKSEYLLNNRMWDMKEKQEQEASPRFLSLATVWDGAPFAENTGG